MCGWRISYQWNHPRSASTGADGVRGLGVGDHDLTKSSGLLLSGSTRRVVLSRGLGIEFILFGAHPLRDFVAEAFVHIAPILEHSRQDRFAHAVE